MKKLPLIIADNSMPNILEACKLSRSFPTMKLDGISLDKEEILKVIETHGANIRHLILQNINMLPENFLAVLKTVPMVKKMSFDEVKFNYFNTIENPANLNHLTHVVINETSPHVRIVFDDVNLLNFSSLFQILNFFNAPNIVSLKQANFNFQLFAKNLPNLNELVLRSKTNLLELETLTIVPLRLKKLSLAFSNDVEILKLLDNTKDSLEELEVIDCASMEVFEFIFKKLKKLKLLSINIDDIPEEKADDKRLRVNASVKTLILQSSRLELDNNIKAYIENLPNIETLVIDCPIRYADLISFISVSLTKLKVLEMVEVRNEFFIDVNFTSVRELFIHESNLSIDGLQAMTRSFLNIERLSIESPYDMCLKSEERLLIIRQNLTKLKHLYLGAGFIASKEGFEHLWQTGSNLESFTITKSAIDVGSSLPTDFSATGPRLIILDNRIEFSKSWDPWLKEDVQFTSYDIEDHDDFSGDSIEFEWERENDEEDYDNGWISERDDDYSDDEQFFGAHRPG